MIIPITPDTTTLTRDLVNAGKVGIGVHERKKVESDQIKLTGTQQSAKIVDNPVAKELGVNLQFAVDKDTGEQLVKVLDPATGKVLHQYPTEEFLQVVKNLRNLKGAFFSARL